MYVVVVVRVVVFVIIVALARSSLWSQDRLCLLYTSDAADE